MHPLAYGPTPVAGTQTPSHRHPFINFSASHNVSIMTPALTHCDGSPMWTHHNESVLESVLEDFLDWVGSLPRYIEHYGMQGKTIWGLLKTHNGMFREEPKVLKRILSRNKTGKT